MVNSQPVITEPMQADNKILKILASKVSSIVGNEEDQATPISGLMLYKRNVPTAAGSATYEPSISIVLQGKKRVDLGGTVFIYNASHYLLNSVDLPVLGQVIEATVDKPYLCMVLKLQMPVIRDLISRDDIASVKGFQEGKAMVTSQNTAEMLQAFSRLIDLLDHPSDLSFMSELIHREIVYRVLAGPEGAQLRTIATHGHHSNRIAKAISWLKINYAKPLHLEELALLSGMGLSTLHHHFKSLTSLPPLQYQKQIRLHNARNMMFVDKMDAASAAFEVGYESASQFSREYSRFFGKPPVRDIQELRQSLDKSDHTGML
jgi:AraC-like DNA-binding protein